MPETRCSLGGRINRRGSSIQHPAVSARFACWSTSVSLAAATIAAAGHVHRAAVLGRRPAERRPVRHTARCATPRPCPWSSSRERDHGVGCVPAAAAECGPRTRTLGGPSRL